jgi:hypothetical protein
MRLRYSATDRDEAWDFIRTFAATWSRPLDNQDGCAVSELAEAETRLDRRLPAAVTEAYQLMGKRNDLTRSQDYLQQPHNLEVEDSRWLVYRVENQGCALWAVDLADPGEPDPPTRWRDPTTATGTWRAFLDRFSQAVVEMALSESLFSGDIADNRELDDTALAALEASYEPLGFPDYEGWASPGGPPVRWCTGDDILLREDHRTWLWAHARTAAALDDIRRILPGGWLMQ